MAEHGRWPLPILRQTLSSQRKKLSPPIPWKQGGGFLGSLALPQSWASRRVHDSPCRPPPPTPSVANRGCLVPAPIELPCSLHTKNGNPQAILGALPSQAVATVLCFHRAAGPSSKPYAQPCSLWASLRSTLPGALAGRSQPGPWEALGTE